MKTEKRVLRLGEVRATGERSVEAVVLTYNVVDDYNTRFRPGVFTESLKRRMPRMVWAHRWDDPIGRWVDYRDNDIELVLIGEFDDFDAVPRARQAHAQLLSGTIDQFSVGFSRTSDEAVDPAEVDGLRGIVDITKGDLDEASLVLVGAVPGTRPLAVRSKRGMVEIDAVLEIAKRVVAGEITSDEAAIAIELASTDDPAKPEHVEPPPTEVTALDEELDADEAELADAS